MREDKPYGEFASRRTWLTRLAVAGFGLAVAAISALLAVTEIDGRQQLSHMQNALRTADTPQVPHLLPMRTLDGERRQMLFCLNGQTSAAFFRLPQPARHDVATACLTRAQEILTQSPSRSLAHLVRADALLRLGELDAAVSALQRAQATGVREGWMAVVRLRLAFRMLDMPTLMPRHHDALRGMARADLALVANAPELADRLAVLFLHSGLHRDMMLEVIEGQLGTTQASFVNAVDRVQRGQSRR